MTMWSVLVDFWDDHVIIPSVRVFYRHPSFYKKPLMIICVMSDDFNVFEIHAMMSFENMARKFGVNYDRTSLQHFCAHKSASSVIFRPGHSIQNRTDCNWFFTLLYTPSGVLFCFSLPTLWQKKNVWFQINLINDVCQKMPRRRIV